MPVRPAKKVNLNSGDSKGWGIIQENFNKELAKNKIKELIHSININWKCKRLNNTNDYFYLWNWQFYFSNAYFIDSYKYYRFKLNSFEEYKFMHKIIEISV